MQEDTLHKFVHNILASSNHMLIHVGYNKHCSTQTLQMLAIMLQPKEYAIGYTGSTISYDCIFIVNCVGGNALQFGNLLQVHL
jgi:hypothetical protein